MITAGIYDWQNGVGGQFAQQQFEAPHVRFVPKADSCSAANFSLSALQVRREIDVVTHLAVDLKAVALTVGDDDLISLRIEVDRRRKTEAPERLEIARPPVRP